VNKEFTTSVNQSVNLFSNIKHTVQTLLPARLKTFRRDCFQWLDARIWRYQGREAHLTGWNVVATRRCSAVTQRLTPGEWNVNATAGPAFVKTAPLFPC